MDGLVRLRRSCGMSLLSEVETIAGTVRETRREAGLNQCVLAALFSVSQLTLAAHRQQIVKHRAIRRPGSSMLISADARSVP